MKLLVLYATSEGQTRKIAEFAADLLRQRNHAVILADAATEAKQLDLSAFDATILASRIHAGRHHRAMVSFVRRYRHLLAAMNTVFLSVSLSAARFGEADDTLLARYRADFVRATGWQPGAYHDVAGARFYSRHNRLTRWILGLVDHHRFDTDKDHEFTDWAELRVFLDRWADHLESDTLVDAPFRRQPNVSSRGR